MQLPAIRLEIAPQLGASGAVQGLRCCLRLDIPTIHKDEVLVQMHKKSGVVPSQKYDSLLASDDNGALDLVSSEDDNVYSWYATRTTAGRIVLDFYATPRIVGPKTRIGSRIDMRSDHGGVGVAGLTFLPLPLAEVDHAIVVHWKLKGNVSAVWSFGEGSGPHQVVGPPSMLQETYFAAGLVQSFVDKGFGFYWFGDLPKKIEASARWSEKLFSKMAPFFHDSTSTYRVFVRNASPARGYGGTAFRYSYCLEYDADLDIIPSADVNQLLAHEMVHNWPMIGKNSDSDETQKIYDWYNEGIADYYAVVLPHDVGLLDDLTFVQQVNDLLVSYYTHPYIKWSNKRLADTAWKDIFAITLPYVRGFTYLLKVSGQLGPAKFNKIVNELLEIKTKRSLCTEQDWLDRLCNELGHQAKEEFLEMTRGELIIPKDAIAEHTLVRQDKEKFDLGMASSSFNERKVSDLRPDSRAAKAGIKNGDAIVSNTPVFLCEAHPRELMKLKVLRNDERLEFQYRPRSWDKVEAWQFEKNT